MDPREESYHPEKQANDMLSKDPGDVGHDPAYHYFAGFLADNEPYSDSVERDRSKNDVWTCVGHANELNTTLSSVLYQWNLDAYGNKTTLRAFFCVPKSPFASNLADRCPWPRYYMPSRYVSIFVDNCVTPSACDGQKIAGYRNGFPRRFCHKSAYGVEVFNGNEFVDCPSGVVAENDRNNCLVAGCTDPEMDNYNADAGHDDGSCVKDGCTDPEMDNYDAKVTTDDGTCFIIGCMIEEMDNYDANATRQDDDSCVKKGCTNSLSSNFDPAATVDDGSCLQPPGSNVYDECARLKTAYKEEQWVVENGDAHRAEGNETGAACCLENPSDDCLEWSQEYQRLQCCDGRVCKKVTCDLGYKVQHLDECNQFCKPIDCIRFNKDQDDGHKAGDVDWVKMAEAKAIRAACVKEDMQNVDPLDPPCQSWFDGCNTCIASLDDKGQPDGGLPLCTKKYCSAYAEANCLD